MKNLALVPVKASHILFFLSFLLLISCTKEEQTFKDFRASINGTLLEPGGECNRNITETDTVFAIHSQPMSDFTETFYFNNIPEVKTVTTFYDQDIDFSLLTVTDQLPGYKKYRPVSGKLVVNPPLNNMIEGTFSMVVVNIDTKMNDTVFIDKGYFKLSYSTYWIRELK